MIKKIINIPVPSFVYLHVQEYLDKGNGVGHRSSYNGTKIDALIGLTAESVVRHYCTGYYTDFSKREPGFDGGIDYTKYGCKVDVKTKGRNARINENYPNHLEWAVSYPSQQTTDNYNADIVIFTSYVYNWSPNQDYLQILGWFPHGLIQTRFNKMRPGDKVYRDDGSYFLSKNTEITYDGRIKDLYDMEDLTPTDDIVQGSCRICGGDLYEGECVTGDPEYPEPCLVCDDCDEVYTVDEFEMY